MIAPDSTPQGLPSDHGFTTGFWVCTGVAVLAVFAALALPSARRGDDRQSAPASAT